MRICFISHSAYMGGAERAMLESVSALTKRGVTCHVLLPYEGPLCEELSRMNIPFQVIKYQPWVHKGSTSWWWRTRSLLLSLIMVIPASQAVVRWKSTVIWTNTITVFTGALAALLTRRPHIWHIHEYGYDEHGLKFLYGKRLTLHLVNRLSVLCIVTSKAMADAFQGVIPSSKLKIIYQSVSVSYPDASIQQGKKAFKCVIVGKISEGKNQEEAVEAVAELSKKGMNIELHIIGDGYADYVSRLTSLIQKKGIQNNVRFMGYCSDAFSHMCGADVILVCSKSEAFGRVTVEGMLAGKPVVGAKSGATAELILDGVTGLLYSPGIYKELAQKIQYLYDNPSLAMHMGRDAREWALSKFSEGRYGEELMEVLLRVAKSAPGMGIANKG